MESKQYQCDVCHCMISSEVGKFNRMQVQMVVTLKDHLGESIRIIEKEGSNDMMSHVKTFEFCSSECVARFIQESKDKAIRKHEVKEKKKELDMLKTEREWLKYKEWEKQNANV